MTPEQAREIDDKLDKALIRIEDLIAKLKEESPDDPTT